MFHNLLSIIFGLLSGCLIGIVLFCKGSGVRHGPNSKNIVGNVYDFDGKYYKFRPKICACPLL